MGNTIRNQIWNIRQTKLLYIQKSLTKHPQSLREVKNIWLIKKQKRNQLLKRNKDSLLNYSKRKNKFQNYFLLYLIKS